MLLQQSLNMENDEVLANLQSISKIESEIESYRIKIYNLQRELEQRKKVVANNKVNVLLSDLKVPFLLRDLYVFTYYYKGCYPWDYAIWYGLPRQSEYKDTVKKLSPEENAATMKIASHNFNKIVKFSASERHAKPSDYEWTEKNREDDASPLSLIDKSVIYVVVDETEKSEYETVLGVYTNPVELAKVLEEWDYSPPSIYHVVGCFPTVHIHVVQGNECCILYPSKDPDEKISFSPHDYKANIAQVILTLTNKALQN